MYYFTFYVVLQQKNLPHRYGMGGHFHFTLLFGFLFPEDTSEDQPHKRSAIEHLVEYRHRKVHSPCLDERAECLRLFEQTGGDQAHDRAHDAADADRDRVGDKLRSVIRAHHSKCKHARDLSYDKELQYECDRCHNRKLMKCRQKCLS